MLNVIPKHVHLVSRNVCVTNKSVLQCRKMQRFQFPTKWSCPNSSIIGKYNFKRVKCYYTQGSVPDNLTKDSQVLSQVTKRHIVRSFYWSFLASNINKGLGKKYRYLTNGSLKPLKHTPDYTAKTLIQHLSVSQGDPHFFVLNQHGFRLFV